MEALPMSDSSFLESWHDFFIAVSGGAAALTGLVFVAMSLHLKAILGRPVLMSRAKLVLTSLTAAFLRCLLALMGSQSRQAVALELFGVCVAAALVNGFTFSPLFRNPAPVPRVILYRYLGVHLFLLVEMTGAAYFYYGASWGLYLAATAMVFNFYYGVSGAWLLLIGVTHDVETRPRSRRKLR
jgi:hypothetical protein